MTALETIDLRKSFGGLTVANSINYRMEVGARNALIGPNGAGKTTFVNLVSGALTSSSGAIRLNGSDVTKLGEAQRVKRGLVRTFQINRLFRGLSALENVGLAIAEREGVAADIMRPAGRYRAVLDEAYAILDGLGLGQDALRKVSDLAYGRQRLTEIAIALGLKPKVLLLDEPAAGVPSGEVGTIVGVVEKLPADLALVLIDHDMDLVFRIARHITVLAEGGILAEGSPAAISENPEVRRVYLGERKHR